MTYKKPADVTYTQMCIYIDENVYKEEGFDEQLVYEYIYHIAYMLAKNGQLFKQHKYYDDFAIYAANRVFFRLTNKKQFQYNEDGTPRMEKIKSVLNYLRNLLYPLKVDFEQSEYCQTISRDANIENINYSFNSVLTNAVDELNFCEFGLTFNNIGRTCEEFLKTIPYKTNSAEWLNIYVSVMLTFLNNVTLTNKRIRRLKHLNGTNRLKDEHIFNAYEQESQSKAILFHLDESMNNYVIVLARQLKNLVAKDLSDILHTNVSNDIVLNQFTVDNFMEDTFEEQDEY